VSSANPPFAHRGRAGFTLIEMMVALVILGLLTTALWQIVRSQSAFVASETQREDAQDNARAALDILTGDLRAAVPQGVVRAGDAELELALPKAWGVACGGGNALSLTAVFPALPADAFTRSSASGLAVNTAAGTAAPVWTPRPAVGVGRGVVAAAAAANLAAAPCSTMGAQGAGLVAYTFTGTNFPVAAAGQVVLLYQLVRYDVSQSEGKWWLKRSTGMDLTGTTFTMTPLAGPIPAQDSLRFTYYVNAAGTQIAAPGTTVATLDSLSRIKVKVVTQSNGQYQGRSNYERDSSVVLLRNRTTSLQCSQGVSGAPC